MVPLTCHAFANYFYVPPTPRYVGEMIHGDLTSCKRVKIRIFGFDVDASELDLAQGIYVSYKLPMELQVCRLSFTKQTLTMQKMMNKKQKYLKGV